MWVHELWCFKLKQRVMAGDAEKIKLLYGSHPPLSLGNHVITLHKNQLRTPVSEKKIKKNKTSALPSDGKCSLASRLGTGFSSATATAIQLRPGIYILSWQWSSCLQLPRSSSPTVWASGLRIISSTVQMSKLLLKSHMCGCCCSLVVSDSLPPHGL